jgi:hypothetical protein
MPRRPPWRRASIRCARRAINSSSYSRSPWKSSDCWKPPARPLGRRCASPKKPPFRWLRPIAVAPSSPSSARLPAC